MSRETKYSVWVFLFLVIAVLCAAIKSAHADHLTAGFGPSLNGNTNPKYFSLGYEDMFSQSGSLLFQCGIFFEDVANVGNCSAVLSLRVQTPSGLFMRIGAGPGAITRTDDRLSSILEANIRYALGVTAFGCDVGFEGSHWSNAGFVPPNLGRDFIGGFVGIHL